MRTLVFAQCLDQVNISELAPFELLMRRAQQVDIKYKDRAQRNTISGENVPDEAYLILGTTVTRGQLMMNPELEHDVAREMGKEGALLKERHKLAEERK